MAMSEATAKADIKSGLEAIQDAIRLKSEQLQDDEVTDPDLWVIDGLPFDVYFAKEFSDLIVEKLAAMIRSGTVSTNVNVTSVAGVTPGPGTSGPGTGTGSGSIS